MSFLTAQEIFTKVVTHLRKQGDKAIDKATMQCVYRAAGGLSCAAGCLISDEHYSQAFEQQVVTCAIEEQEDTRSILLRQALINSGVSFKDFKLVKRLQTIHDCWKLMEWEEAWNEVAQEYGLEMPPLNG